MAEASENAAVPAEAGEAPGSAEGAAGRDSALAGAARTPGARPQPAETAAQPAKLPSLRRRNALVLAVVAVLWLAADMLTKGYFNSFSPGEDIAGPFLGLFRFRLVHNTGAAWGMFDESTVALGVLSLVVCAFLLVYLFVFTPRASMMQAVGLSLVFAGGLGNAIDRFSQGYVVDFIDLAFMDFPVFNVADIGVTCGFALFIVGMLWEWRRAEGREERGGEAPREPRSR